MLRIDDPATPISVQLNGRAFERLSVQAATDLARALTELAARAIENQATIATTTAAAVFTCSAETPCCTRRSEYNGYGSGPMIFRCSKSCPCHD